MGPYYYVVEKIEGEYAYLKRTDINSDELFMIALALLPEGSDLGAKLKWENLIYELM